VPMSRRFALAVFRMTEVCLPSGSECTREQFVVRAMHSRGYKGLQGWPTTRDSG
jgi:hypothetical protein